VQAAKELHRALERKKQGVSGNTMQALRDLSKLFLDTARAPDRDSWKDNAKTNDMPRRE